MKQGNVIRGQKTQWTFHIGKNDQMTFKDPKLDKDCFMMAETWTAYRKRSIMKSQSQEICYIAGGVFAQQLKCDVTKKFLSF